MARALPMPREMPAQRIFRTVSEPLGVLFSDPAVRNGIKFALAGTVSLFFALLIRLEEPTWAVTTAFVLSTPKFVGAIAEKTVLRIVGALCGAVIGYLITGSLQQNPVLFLGAMGVLVATTTALYGGTLAPYGFRQCGYTATLVATQGLMNPAFSWHVGLARCEEICLGIIVTMIITTTIWPRYARKEFSDEVRGTLSVLGCLFRQRTDGFLSGGDFPAPDVLGTVGTRLAKLRKMIRLGCMESTGFRHRRDKVDAVVAQLGVLSTSLSNFGRTLPAESHLREYIETEIIALHDAMVGTIEALADPASNDASRRAFLDRTGGCLRAYESRLLAFRLDGLGENLDVGESLEHAGYALAVHEIFDSLTALATLLPSVDDGQAESFPLIRFEKFTMPDGEWIRAGIRGGLAVTTGLFLLDWLRPPGGDLLVVGTYLFTAFSLENTERKGDLGVFNVLAGTVVACVVFFVFLLVTAPMMSSYAVLNILLGTFLFVTGYLLEKGSMRSFATLVSLLMCVILVGLNAQRPVAFQSIAGPVMGLVLAAVLSAVMRRLIWPALPQNELRERMVELLGLLASSRPESSLPIPERARVALSAADAQTLVGLLEGTTLASDEAERLRTYIHCLARLGGHLMFSTGVNPMPPEASKLYLEQRALLLTAISRQLEAQRVAFEKSEKVADTAPLPDVRSWTPRCRVLIRGAGLDVITNSACLGLLYRHEQSAIAADLASRTAATLSIKDDLDDRVL